MVDRENPGRGEWTRRDDDPHHVGFDAALEEAVQDWAESRSKGPTTEPVELAVRVRVFVSKTNPGRIEKYGVDVIDPGG